MRKYIISFILVLSAFFTGFANVNADVTCDYGIQCKYSLKNFRESVGGGYQMGGGYLYVVFQCADNSKSFSECSSFSSKAAASKQDMSANAFFETGGNPGEEITITNYSDLFGTKANDFKDKFNINNKFSCPVMYYNGDGNSNKITLGFENFAYNNMGRMAFTAEPLAEFYCINKGQNVDDDDLQDQATEDASNAYADEELGKNNNTFSDIGIIGAIKEWGNDNLDDTEFDNVDPCALISGETQKLLHQVFLFISIAGIMILVVMTAISLVKVITASEDNALSNFLKGLWKRIICLIILLLLPVIITFLIQVVNGVGVAWNINSDNPLCNVTE